MNTSGEFIRNDETAPPAKKKGGRPPKFSGPRRPVTVTLPQHTLDQLAGIDEDRAQAIVKAVSQYGGWSPMESSVEFVAVSPDASLLLVRSCPALSNVPGLRLAEIVPGRYLLLFSSGTASESLELALGDILTTLPTIPGGDREVVEQLLGILSRSRRSLNIDTRQIVIVSTAKTV